MEPFNTPLKIREISLPHRAVFGPMAGFTDAPARRLMAQHGAGFTVSEMVSSRALVYGDHKTVSLLKAEPNGAPYGVQIFGEVPEIMGQAAAAVEHQRRRAGFGNALQTSDIQFRARLIHAVRGADGHGQRIAAAFLRKAQRFLRLGVNRARQRFLR